MRTDVEIKDRIKEIENDIVNINNLYDGFDDEVSKVTKVASISAAKRQILLLEWVLKDSKPTPNFPKGNVVKNYKDEV